MSYYSSTTDRVAPQATPPGRASGGVGELKPSRLGAAPSPTWPDVREVDAPAEAGEGVAAHLDGEGVGQERAHAHWPPARLVPYLDLVIHHQSAVEAIRRRGRLRPYLMREAIRCHQFPSDAISGRLRPYVVVIKGLMREAIRCHQMPYVVVIKGLDPLDQGRVGDRRLIQRRILHSHEPVATHASHAAPAEISTLEAGLVLTNLMREAISMQSACNQHAISMQSACNQHAISMQSFPLRPGSC